MKNCEICGMPLAKSELEGNCINHSKCLTKKRLVKSFMDECKEFKKIINYDEILRRREAGRSD